MFAYLNTLIKFITKRSQELDSDVSPRLGEKRLGWTINGWIAINSMLFHIYFCSCYVSLLTVAYVYIEGNI